MLMADRSSDQSQGGAAHDVHGARSRLNEVTAELEDISRRRLRRLPNSWTPAIERRSEELEEEADQLRNSIGEPPATGRPPKRSWVGWVILVGAVILIAAAVAAFNGLF